MNSSQNLFAAEKPCTALQRCQSRRVPETNLFLQDQWCTVQWMLRRYSGPNKTHKFWRRQLRTFRQSKCNLSCTEHLQWRAWQQAWQARTPSFSFRVAGYYAEGVLSFLYVSIAIAGAEVRYIIIIKNIRGRCAFFVLFVVAWRVGLAQYVKVLGDKSIWNKKGNPS